VVTVGEHLEPRGRLAVIEVDLHIGANHRYAFHRRETTLCRDGSPKCVTILEQRDAAMRNVGVEPAGDTRKQLSV